MSSVDQSDEYRYAVRDDPSLAANEERFRQTFTHAPLAQTITTLDGEIVVANERWQRYLGYHPRELLAKTVWDISHPDDVDRSRRHVAALIAGAEEPAVFDKRYVRSDGEILYARTSIALVRGDDGEPLYLNGIIEDRTEQVRMQAILDAETAFYDAAARDLGEEDLLRTVIATVEALVPRSVASILLTDDNETLRLASAPSLPPAVRAAIATSPVAADAGPCGRAAFSGGTVVVTDVSSDAGCVAWSAVMREHGIVACWAVPIVAPDGSVVGTFTIYHGSSRPPLPEHVTVTERLAKFLGLALIRQRERNALRFDPEVMLPNRARLQQLVRARATDASPATLFVFDLLGYVDIAAGLGRAIGLAALSGARDRILALLGDGDVLASLGGARFAVLRSTAVDSGRSFVDDLAFALAAPVTVEGFPFHLTVRVGVAVGSDGARLIEQAETALARAHETAQDVVRFHPTLEAPYARRLAFAREFREALETDQLFLEYQPKFSLPGLRPVGVECLARWQGEARSPAQFVPLAEQTGLMPHLTRFVLRSAARQWRRWSSEGLELPVAVNVSPSDLGDPRFEAALREVLADLGVPAEALQLEITEEAVMANPEQVVPTLRRLRAAGIAIALDDFGVGHSSLALLRHFPLDFLKIDRSFVLAVERDPVRQAIVSSVVRLAHALQLRVVAEGVETEAACGVLEELGCDELQGFHLARPTDAAGVARIVEGAELPPS